MIELTDKKAEELLELILIAVSEYGGTDKTMTIEDFVEDIAMSMDRTSDRADQLRRAICEVLA